jgi:alpha-ketoglutarate-dependent taurine dioxygenase
MFRDCIVRHQTFIFSGYTYVSNDAYPTPLPITMPEPYRNYMTSLSTDTSPSNPEHNEPLSGAAGLARRSQQWLQAATINLSGDALITGALDSLGSRGVTHQTWKEADLLSDPDAKQRLIALGAEVRSKLINHEIGGALLDFGHSINGDPAQIERAKLLVQIIGQEFGTTLTVDPEKHSAFFTVSQRAEGNSKNYVGDGQNNKRPGVHNDGSGFPDRRIEFLALLCVSRAESGGVTWVVDAQRIYQALPNELKRALTERLFTRQNPYDPHSSTPLRRAIFEPVQSELFTGMAIYYHRSQTENAHAYINDLLSLRDIAILDELDDYLNDANFRVELTLQSGQVLMLNNLIRCHDRSAFTDSLEFTRHLERYWSGTLKQEPLINS